MSEELSLAQAVYDAVKSLNAAIIAAEARGLIPAVTLDTDQWSQRPRLSAIVTKVLGVDV